MEQFQNDLLESVRQMKKTQRGDTEYLLCSPSNAASLAESIKQYRREKKPMDDKALNAGKGTKKTAMKIDQSVSTIKPKARIEIVKINPELDGAILVTDSPSLNEKRAHALSLGVSVPSWGNHKINAPKDHTLSDAHREKLIKCPGRIWFKNASIDDKNDFLNAVEMALSCAASRRKNTSIDLSPRDQKEKLENVVASLRSAQKELGLLSGAPLHYAENAHALMDLTHYFSGQKDPSVFLMNKECDGDFRAMLAHTWMYLHDTINTLEKATKRINPSRQNKPSNYDNDEFIERLAGTWMRHSGKYPTSSKDGWFYLFLEELGSLINEKFTDAEVSRVINKIKSTNKKPV